MEKALPISAWQLGTVQGEWEQHMKLAEMSKLTNRYTLEEICQRLKLAKALNSP